MEKDATPESDPAAGGVFKSIIDTAWLKLNGEETGGRRPDGRWRKDS